MKKTDKHKASYNLPEGYFEELKKGLHEISDRNPIRVLFFRASWKMALGAAAAVVLALSLFWPRENVQDPIESEEILAYLEETDYIEYSSMEVVDAYLEWDFEEESNSDENLDYLSEHYSLNDILSNY